MADDAMDWDPTTPPPPHNPYSHPEYIPGGWPKSLPSHRITPGVFAKRKEPGFVERAGKRICRGIKTVGRLAVYPVKPIYIVIRRLRNRQRQASNRPQRSSAPNRAHPPTLRARIAAVEQRARLPTPHQSVTPPPTPPFMSGALRVDDTIEELQRNIYSPTASSVTNTETFVETPSTIRSTLSQNSNNATADLKRRRNQEQREEEQDSSKLLYSSLESYLAAQAVIQQPTPEPDTPPSAKRMKANPFDASYKQSPISYGARGARPGLRVNAIGNKLQNAGGAAKYFGGWEFAKPIKLPVGPIIPDEQLQFELGSSMSKQNQEFEENEERGEAQLRESSAEGSKSEVKNHRAETAKPDNVETKAKLGSRLRYDERWTMARVRTVVINEDDYPPVDQRDSISNAPAPALVSESATSTIERLFYGNKSLVTPPPVRPRIVGSSSASQSKDRDAVKQETIGSDDEENKTTVKSQDKSVEALAETKTDVTENKLTDLSAIPAREMTSEIKSEDSQLEVRRDSLLVPVTPMKVIAEKPATEKVDDLIQEPAKTGMKTPVTKLSKLSIEDLGDKDTPKATPHSGSKTVRVTRYREALEKAQRAKLEQYELVPITTEWDKKVRSAVRGGIPGYLGPHDLARVVPQYANRGQDNWLNDETINKYLELVADHGRKNDRPGQVRSHHAFNNFFYNNLRDKGADSVSRWSKRAKIGGKNLSYVEKVFVPINSGAHWTLAVVEPTQKRITHYNSMRGTATGIRACEDLKRWVATELGKDFKEEEWTLAAVGESPQQTNSDDCGVFTITSARQIMLGYTPMSYGPAQIPIQRIRIVAELINKGLLKSSAGA